MIKMLQARLIRHGIEAQNALPAARMIVGGAFGVLAALLLQQAALFAA